MLTPSRVWAQPGSTTTTSAQPDYFGKKTVPQDVSFRQARPRTTKQHIVLAGLFGGAVLFGGLGLYFHLDSRSAADEVSLMGGTPTRIYDFAVRDVRDRAVRSRTVAIVGYSVAGAFLVATLVAMAMTHPGDEIVTIDDGSKTPSKVPLSIAPVPGGAIVGGAWRF